MGSDINLVVIEGRLTGEPTHKATTGGTSLTTFRIANNRWIPGKNGADGREDTNFITVSCWGAVADRAAGRLQKGTKVVLKGRWQVRQWKEEESGQTREGHELVADDVEITSGGRTSQDDRGD
jgi:single-strand DNA-binding protein